MNIEEKLLDKNLGSGYKSLNSFNSLKRPRNSLIEGSPWFVFVFYCHTVLSASKRSFVVTPTIK